MYLDISEADQLIFFRTKTHILQGKMTDIILSMLVTYSAPCLW